MADTSQKPVKKFNAKATGFTERAKLVTEVIANMDVQAEGAGRTGIMLAGDPGVGKTSFIRFFAKLLGMDLITIEAPHVTEEHIINIPFIVLNPASGTPRTLDTEGEFDADYKVVMSDSNLYTQLQRAKRVPDEQYLKLVYASGDQVLIKVFEKLGGSEKQIPDMIKDVRARYEVILFLDEYFRQTSMRVRNMLRTILNGKIGNHPLPHTAYVVYASNINDEGVEGMPLNNDFQTIQMEHPSKEEWFSWFVNKFEHDEHVKINPKLVQQFFDLLEDEHLSIKDIEADVRVSPRRWEQLLLYINSALPVKSAADGTRLLTNVKHNFRNYLTGSHAKIADAVVDAVIELVEDTSGFKLSNTTLGASEWRETLEHQIEAKMRLGDARTYIPIVAGLPGVGKTTEMHKLGADLNLAVVDIDVSTLSADDVSGIPLPKTKSDKEGGGIETRFSMPKLFQHIKQDMKRAEAAHLEALKKAGKTDKIEAYKKAKWKYILFFDELNRNSQNVFNGIRRLILEKNLGDKLELPPGTIMVAALNPEDQGAEKLTQHMVDVSDIIDAAPSWPSTKHYIENIKFARLKNPEVKDFVFSMLNAFNNEFHAKKGPAPKNADREFFIITGGANQVYVSPREWSNLYSNAVKYVDHTLSILRREISERHDDDHTKEQMQRDVLTIKHAVYKSFESTLNTVMIKHGVHAPEFLHSLKRWFENMTEVNVETLFFAKKAETESFSDIVAPYLKPGGPDLADSSEFVNYVNNADVQNLKDDISTFLEKQLQNIEDVIETTHPKKVLKNGRLEQDPKKLVSQLEHTARELVHAFRIHDFSHEKAEIMQQVMLEFMKRIGTLAVEQDALMKLLATSGNIKNFVKGTQP